MTLAVAGWLGGIVWVHVESFLHSVASPFHSFVPTLTTLENRVHKLIVLICDDQSSMSDAAN